MHGIRRSAWIHRRSRSHHQQRGERARLLADADGHHRIPQPSAKRAEGHDRLRRRRDVRAARNHHRL